MINSYDKNCTGCQACVQACPKQCIVMVPDQNGFIYPKANASICIKCGLCKKICPNNTRVRSNDPIATFVAVQKDGDILKNSSSGGVFAALASFVLEKKGVVFGCILNEKLEAVHIGIIKHSDIEKMQGSKYFQSNVKSTYTEAKKYLQEGRQVFYTGTPCQIAGLKSYLGREYDNLITADLVCHGIASPFFFKGYVNWIEKKLQGKVVDFRFRDKTKIWMGTTSKATIQRGTKTYEKIVSPMQQYYYFFLKGDIYRECCYECRYACSSRTGEFTMGDYWGIEKAHPEIKSEAGVSVLLVNNEKGMALINNIGGHLQLTQSTFEKASACNSNLICPTQYSNKRETILKILREEGFEAINEQYSKELGKKIVLFRVKAMIPVSVKRKVRQIFNR